MVARTSSERGCPAIVPFGAPEGAIGATPEEMTPTPEKEFGAEEINEPVVAGGVLGFRLKRLILDLF